MAIEITTEIITKAARAARDTVVCGFPCLPGDRHCKCEAIGRATIAAVAPLIEAQVSAENADGQRTARLMLRVIELESDLAQAREDVNGNLEKQLREHGSPLMTRAANALAQARAAAMVEAARVALSYGTDLRNHDAVRTAGAAIAAAILALASRPYDGVPCCGNTPPCEDTALCLGPSRPVSEREGAAPELTERKVTPCEVHSPSSRVCQRGTKSCVIDHEGDEAGAYKGDGNTPMQKEDYPGSCQ